MQIEQAKLKNPYLILHPINDPRMFFGPFAVLRTICSIVASHQSVALVGSRHSGKTTLLRCLSQPAIQASFEEYDFSRHLFVYLDVRNCLRKTSEGFLDFMCEEIITASRGRIELSSPKVAEDRFMDILRQVKEQGLHTVMLLDVFDDIARSKAFDPEFFMFLRAQANIGLVSYVTASIQPLELICHHDLQGSPFFTIFAKLRIKPLTQAEARDLIMLPSQRADCPFTEEECVWILKLAGRHPFFILRVCYFLFEEKSRRAPSEVNRKRVINQAYRDLQPHFKYLWEGLNEQEQGALKEKANYTHLPERELPELSLSSLFRTFVRDTCGLSLLHMDTQVIQNELAEALKHLDSPVALATSTLRHLKVVTMRIEQKGVTSPFEKGQIIRDILTEVFEQLHGDGERGDTVPSWKVYNLLFYTYFSKNNTKNKALTQAGIAHRLAMSLRHYHREKEDAITALANRLLEMEVACKQEDDE